MEQLCGAALFSQGIHSKCLDQRILKTRKKTLFSKLEGITFSKFFFFKLYSSERKLIQ